MLTLISGWRSAERDKVLIAQRDMSRPTLYFIDNVSTLPTLAPDLPVADVWRNGNLQLSLAPDASQIVRVNYDTDNNLIVRAVEQAMRQHTNSQIVVMFDAVNALYRFFPSLRAEDAVLAADARLDACEGDHVIFMRGGSFSWKDHLLESRTAVLVGEETLDMGVVDEEDMLVNFS